MVTRAHSVRRSPFYRARQFYRALTARPLGATERQAVSTLLSPAQQSLFQQMRTRDQRHSFQVMCTLVERGQSDPDLLTAALLHDVGKSRYPLILWEQPVVVLIRNFRPNTAVQWGNGAPRGWKRPFVVYQRHAEWGAEMAAAAGSSPLVVELIRYHQSKLDDVDMESERLKLLQFLQAADSAN